MKKNVQNPDASSSGKGYDFERIIIPNQGSHLRNDVDESTVFYAKHEGKTFNFSNDHCRKSFHAPPTALSQKEIHIMKHSFLSFMVFVLFTGVAYGMDYEVTKKAGEYTVQVKIDRNPPAVGDNNLMIWLKNADGKDVKGAMMTVDYSIPSRRGKKAKKFSSHAQPHENNYHAILTIPTPGSWEVTIKITDKGKKVSTKFSLDVK
ncbi:MAG: FixH family protein [Deltaproteobacteria bacterium]